MQNKTITAVALTVGVLGAGYGVLHEWRSDVARATQQALERRTYQPGVEDFTARLYLIGSGGGEREETPRYSVK